MQLAARNRLALMQSHSPVCPPRQTSRRYSLCESNSRSLPSVFILYKE